MTNREFYSVVISGNLTADAIQFAKDAVAKMDERNAKRSSQPSKTALANEPIKEKILAFLSEQAGVAKTSPDIALAVGESTQKVSALCNQLAAEGKVEKSEGKVPKKGKMKFYSVSVSVAVAEE